VIYDIVLLVHSFTRWCVLVACVITASYAFAARPRSEGWAAGERILGRVFVGSVDLQVLLGLSLWFSVSPLARVARAVWSTQGFGALWAQPELRFFGVIHPSLALLAGVVAHSGWVGARRQPSTSTRRRWLGASAALALGFLLAAVPWPFLGHERPWFRL